MVFKKSDIQGKISEYQKKIIQCNALLKKGNNNPSELRNNVVDYKLEIKKLEKLLEVC